MLLLKPSSLVLVPSSPDFNAEDERMPIEQEHLNKILSFVYGSIDTCGNVLYYAIPAVVVDGSNEVLFPPIVFAHKDNAVIQAVAVFFENRHKNKTQVNPAVASSNPISIVAGQTDNSANDKYYITQKENERLRDQINRISTLETEVGEVQRERDALTLRLDSVLYELKTVQDLYCLDQLQGQSAVDESSFFPKQQSIIETYQSFVNIYHSK
ncbi:hypothetical protein RFI_13465, partial [Reticulomyxa filosa]